MTLRQIAQGMRQGLDWSRQAGKDRAWNLRSLPRGLQLLLSYQDDRWRLALRRTDVYPSEEEVELCARAFDVPDCPRRRNYTSSEKSSITNHKTVYYIVELTWREIAPAQPEADSQAGHGHSLANLIATGAPFEGPDHEHFYREA
jgi:hypothetical protein